MGSTPHTKHRYFIDSRPIILGHLWLDFALPYRAVADVHSRLQRAVSVTEFAFRFFQRSIRGSISGRYSIILLLELLVREIFLSVTFTSSQANPLRVYMRQHVAALSNGASLAPQLTSIDFAVLPAARRYLTYCLTAK